MCEALERSSWALLNPFTTGDLPWDLEVSSDHTWHIPVIPDSHYITLGNQSSASPFLDLLDPRCVNVSTQTLFLKELIISQGHTPTGTAIRDCCIRHCTHSPGNKSCQLFWLESHGPWSRLDLQGPRNFHNELAPWYEFTPRSSTDPVWHSVSKADRLACRYSRATSLDGKRKQSDYSWGRDHHSHSATRRDCNMDFVFFFIKSHWKLDPFCKNLMPVCHHWPTQYTLKASRSRLLYKLLTTAVVKEVVWICIVLNSILPNQQKSLPGYLKTLAAWLCRVPKILISTKINFSSGSWFFSVAPCASQTFESWKKKSLCKIKLLLTAISIEKCLKISIIVHNLGRPANQWKWKWSRQK